jgi:drug/metabolite transporter (DMT)-like permease
LDRLFGARRMGAVVGRVKGASMNERGGVGIAILSSGLGGGAAVATRYLIGDVDPFTLAAVRFGAGALCLLPILAVARVRWPARRDLPAVLVLGVVFYGLFFVAYNLALGFTTVARGTLALSTLPLVTMTVGAVLGVEALTVRKTAGVLLAMGGVALALATALSGAPPGAWRGDLLMAGATLCMAVYNVAARPLIARSRALGFLATGMAAGGGTLVLVSVFSGGVAAIATLDAHGLLAAAYLAAGGGALAFFLWVLALQHASPTRVANTMPANPLIAGLLAVLILGEPLHPMLLAGLATVFAGIWIATADAAPAAAGLAARTSSTPR